MFYKKEGKAMYKNVTDKYLNMIEAFECDFSIAKNYNKYEKINSLRQLIEDQDKDLLKDIELLEELSFNLRHGILKLMEEN